MSNRLLKPRTDKGGSATCDYTRLEHKMAEAGLDTLIAMGHSNAIYLTGCLDVERWVRNPQDLAILILVITFPDKSFVVGGLGERLRFEGEVYDCDMTLDARLAMVAEQLRVRGLNRGRIGIDLDYTPASSLRKLRRLLPESQFEAADVLLTQMRSAKTPKEVAYI